MEDLLFPFHSQALPRASEPGPGLGPRPSKTRQDKTLDQDTNTPSSSPPPAAFFSSGYLRLFFSRLFSINVSTVFVLIEASRLGSTYSLGVGSFPTSTLPFLSPFYLLVYSSTRFVLAFNPLQSNPIVLQAAPTSSTLTSATSYS